MQLDESFSVCTWKKPGLSFDVQRVDGNLIELPVRVTQHGEQTISMPKETSWQRKSGRKGRSSQRPRARVHRILKNRKVRYLLSFDILSMIFFTVTSVSMIPTSTSSPPAGPSYSSLTNSLSNIMPSSSESASLAGQEHPSSLGCAGTTTFRYSL